jgi:hypothetical protein
MLLKTTQPINNTIFNSFFDPLLLSEGATA